MKFMYDYSVHISIGGPKDFTLDRKTLGGHIVFVVDSYSLVVFGLPLQDTWTTSQPLYTKRVDQLAHDPEQQAQKAKEKVASSKFVLTEKRDLWLRNEGSFSACAPILVEVESLRVDLQGSKASSTENAALIAKKEAEIGMLTRVLSIIDVFNDVTRMKEEVFSM
ncbi:hypothetical protein L7F22_002519 [Adiantum nelumboides]|nr:hypothetical protein [Adiantum nelumboides]